MKKKITLFIVDDHTIFRDGLKTLLSQIIDFKIVGEAKNGVEFLNSLNEDLPEIVLIDISMPEMDGPETLMKALVKYPEIRFIALSSYSDHVYYYNMIKSGARGFVQKDADSKELEDAIRKVHAGENFFPQDILRNLIFKLGNNTSESISDNKIKLSKRELEVLHLICKGNTNAEIAEKLFISPKTVDNHRTSLLSKTNTRNTAHLVMFAIKNKFIEI